MIVESKYFNAMCGSCRHRQNLCIGRNDGAFKREPPVTGVTDGPHTKNMNTKTVTNITGFLSSSAFQFNIFSTFFCS